MNERQLQLDWIYTAIGNEELQCTDAVLARINELEGEKSLISGKATPLSFESWCYDVDIEGQYKELRGEYGDLAGFLSDYKQYHYDDYLKNFR